MQFHTKFQWPTDLFTLTRGLGVKPSPIADKPISEEEEEEAEVNRISEEQAQITSVEYYRFNTVFDNLKELKKEKAETKKNLIYINTMLALHYVFLIPLAYITAIIADLIDIFVTRPVLIALHLIKDMAFVLAVVLAMPIVLAGLFIENVVINPIALIWNKIFPESGKDESAKAEAEQNQAPPKEARVLKEQTRGETAQNDVNDNSAEPDSSAKKTRWCSIL